MRGEDNRFLFPHPLDDAAHFVFFARVQTIGGLIHDEHIWIMDNGLRKAATVPVTFGEGVHTLVQHRLQEAQIDHAVDCLFPIAAADAPDFGSKIKKSVNSHVRIAWGTFGQISHQALGLNGLLQDRVIPYCDRSFRRWNETSNHPHGGGLTGSVSPRKPSTSPRST